VARRSFAHRPFHAGALLGAACILAACGAKTGLELPDAAAMGLPEDPHDAAEPADASVVVPVCIEVPADGTPVRAAFTLPVSLAVVDIMFLLDATGSMRDAIDNVRDRLRTQVAPGVRAAIPDAAFGLAYLGEFPIDPHGPPDVLPYELRTPITADLLRLETALSRHPVWGNYDEPEAQVEALVQAATGVGLSPWIPASPGCPGGGLGGACFRREAFPIMMLITDAPFHNGPSGVAPVSTYRFTPAPHTYADAVAALRALGAMVIGLGAVDPLMMSPMPHLRAIARDTGAVDETGAPLVFDIGATGTRVGSGIVEAVERLAAGVPLDVFATVEDLPGDDVDARDLVQSVRPLSADPMSGVGSIEDDRFMQVHPGTRVTFEIELVADLPEAVEGPLEVPALVVFRAFERTRLGQVEVVFLISHDGGCPE
jgi:predicted small lipoprotein YifL